MTSAHPVAADQTDAELMLRVQADDSAAFGELYDRLAARAFRVADAIARDPARTGDMVEEAFLAVWRSRARFRPEHGTVAAWVMGTVRHRAIEAPRQQDRHDRRRTDDEHIDERVPAPGGVEDRNGEHDEAARVRTTLARLPAAQRDVIALAYFGELSTTEIARELSLPLGTVTGRIRLGLDQLRDDATP